jgi:polyferredoxin
MINRTLQRRLWQSGFFLLFVFAPVFDIFRFDLSLGHFILFGQNWTLGLDAFQKGEMSTLQAVFNIAWRVFLPIALVIGVGVFVSWKYGRLYCGWLCPHFSVVETINRLMQRANGKPSIWEQKPLPQLQADQRVVKPNRLFWIPAAIAVLLFAFLWALVLLTYLLPPQRIYPQLLQGELSGGPLIFLGVATLVLCIEFALARHLFCRFGCAIGVFQSLAWMANKKAMVVGFDAAHADACRQCNNACDNVCPMRLKPRTVKRKMFTCTNCSACIQACDTHSALSHHAPLLKWVRNECALPVSDRGFGRYPEIPAHCFKHDDTASQAPGESLQAHIKETAS